MSFVLKRVLTFLGVFVRVILEFVGLSSFFYLYIVLFFKIFMVIIGLFVINWISLL